MLVHGSNLTQKEKHRTKYQDELSRQYLAEIRQRYDQWHEENKRLKGPYVEQGSKDKDIIEQRVRLFEDYKDFLDQKKYAENFDSRSNLHSSVLEEFLFYLFQDLVADFGQNALIGKSHAFKDIFFAPPNYQSMVERAHASIERKDHDFVIGVTISAKLELKSRVDQDQSNFTGIREEDNQYSVQVDEGRELHTFDIAAVAIECKTYLDKTMLEGSSRAAEQLKARNPNALYIVVSEWLKLTSAVNLKKYEVDQIYVFRKQKNTDREFRYLDSYDKKPIDPEVVFHLFQYVRDHLTSDWETGVEQGLNRGWLL